jgi:hypothetical protein
VHPSIAEAFLKFTPLLHFREPGLLFGDIRQTLWLFKSSKSLLEEILFRAEDLGFKEVSLALSDTAAGAQALTQHFDFFISEPGRESFSLSPLPVSSLKDLEGLKAWDKPAQVEDIAEFLPGLGLRSLGDLMKLPPESWNLRWGDLGSLLQTKISSAEKSVFAPLIPELPLVAYHHFDFPIADREWLLESMKPRLQELLFRLEGREQALDRLSLLMICEYSDAHHRLELSPSHKARDLDLLLTLLRERFKDLSLENPVREWEIEIQPLSSSPQQLDFWEPQAAMEKENLLRLQSLLHDRQIESGFLKLLPAQLPEKSWSFQNEPQPFELPATDFAFEERSHRELPVYSEGLNSAPRPTRILEAPCPITHDELRGFRFLHRSPLERLDLPWEETCRDYWLALNSKQQCVWVFRDLTNSTYYLHGYFD